MSSTTARARLTACRASGDSSAARRASILATSTTSSSVRSFPLMWSAFRKVPREMPQRLVFDWRNYFPIAARNAVKYFSGKAATFIFESVTMWVVSPSATSALLSARTSSYQDFVIVEYRSTVAALDLSHSDEASVLALHVTVGKSHLPHQFHPAYLEPDEMVRMVDHSHLVGFCVAYAQPGLVERMVIV